ncbi:Phosphatidylethanolamine-binding protein [endosymbiont GvMRE of Glomus versiforme]|nr:YbhB/YbcL family Raf kinase inhibitor-like protein [endosymbiont GvMRE of Glomus versiforme]RHZ37042.1 Phosphatidylethanolamine-binding protein [endosymbiont GvMRE of Glomus versiforme]
MQPLQRKVVPNEAKSLVLICEDPDVPKGNWDHRIIFNLPADTNFLTEGSKKLLLETKLGRNSWGKEEYGEPCLPDKKHYCYFFLPLCTLDTLLELPNRMTKEQIKRAISGHVLAKVELIGLYARPWQKN